MSVYARIQDALADAVTGLALVIGGRPVVTRKMKLPIHRDTVDAVPAALVVVGDGPESTVPFTTGNEQLVGYLVQVVLVAGTARQPREGAADLLDAREAVRKLLQRPGAVGAAVGEVLRVEPLPQAPAARQAWAKALDVSALACRYLCVETAT